MAEEQLPETPENADKTALSGGTYEIIRGRLRTHGEHLRSALDILDTRRKDVFGSIEPALLGTERIATNNNCIPRDMVERGNRFLFGYNVHIGLRRETSPADVFQAYEFQDGGFRATESEALDDPQFKTDFADLYRYYRDTTFAQFAQNGPNLYMVFKVGKTASDIKAFKWTAGDDGTLHYVDNRSDHEVRAPEQHEFEWIRTHRDMHRSGTNPHISVEDRLFVETVGGDITIKIEDNTETGEGIYSEPVEQPDQTLDDAEIFYAVVGSLILLKIRPYQEVDYRYIVFSEKLQTAVRLDALADACILLPEDHGIVFPRGYVLQTGEHKAFQNDLVDMRFLRRINSPNGEDYLYIFYNPTSGTYVLLAYNMISQRMQTPIICHGYSLFDDGRLIYFRAGEQAQKTHALQIWQTPFVHAGYEFARDKSSFLYKVGNHDIVRAMAACNEVLGLIGREDTFSDLYLDIVQRTTDVLDANYWLDNKEAGGLLSPLQSIRDAARSAIDEFEKVVRIRQETGERIKQITLDTRELLNDIRLARFDTVEVFVDSLARLRALRGEVIGLRDLRYIVDSDVDALEKKVTDSAEQLSQNCVAFLLRPDSMDAYAAAISGLIETVPALEKVSDADVASADVAKRGEGLEMLIDTVSNLKIDDATQRTEIIDRISAIFATLNRVRSALRNRTQELASREGSAEFASQVKLLGQAVANYLDVCDTPSRCEEYLSKLMVQVEELEGRFSDFDAYVEELTAKREEIYEAFETRKQSLLEERTRKCDSLGRSAERILKGIRTRIQGFDSVEEISGYLAADMMIEKVRDITDQLDSLDDTVKAGDIRTQLKAIREDSLRQLKDRKELFVDGKNIITFGTHKFAVNTQALDLTMVRRDEGMCLHLTGTDFFEPVEDEVFNALRSVWDQPLISETDDIYRAEFLAYTLFQSLSKQQQCASFVKLGADARMSRIREFMATRYAEGYIKGVTDTDATELLTTLCDTHTAAGLLRHSPTERALGLLAWQTGQSEQREMLAAQLAGLASASKVFPAAATANRYRENLCLLITDTADALDCFATHHVNGATDYMLAILVGGHPHPVSKAAADLHACFQSRLKRPGAQRAYDATFQALDNRPLPQFLMLLDWLQACASAEALQLSPGIAEEVAAFILLGDFDRAQISECETTMELTGLAGSHPRIQGGSYSFNYHRFMERLSIYVTDGAPCFTTFQARKKHILDATREDMRLEDFKPRVLTTFVRNELIDRVYLPLIGDNLAKQLGEVGNQSRTDRMGMLLLISPPGYGKTTLMEYIASQLGLVFMKINGPAIGHRVTSLDPSEAPNASAREELRKLNLSLEMGDNVMLYLDDIQHCSPELLQKFISLCDGQRKIEGVYKGKPQTYDLRGKSVAVVMAGNPYTESGDMFRIPDMLANRADTYNLGDIIGDSDEAFKLSYIENALTSNPALAKLAAHGRKDTKSVIQIARHGTREGVDLEGNYGPDELADAVSVMKKLLRIQDVVLTVNQAYIASAAQADDYRTEPPFKLQGSYRNMNRMSERVQPVMNDSELESLILDHYTSEAQTLTTGAEANLLKFKTMTGVQSETEAARWDEIKRTFGRNQMLRNVDAEDPVGQVVAQLGSVGEGLHGIQSTVAKLAAQQIEDAKARQRQADSHASESISLSNTTLNALTAPLVDISKKQTEIEKSIQARAQEPPTPDANKAALEAACRRWRRGFLNPLLRQSMGAAVEEAVNTDNLQGMLDEMDQLLAGEIPIPEA